MKYGVVLKYATAGFIFFVSMWISSCGKEDNRLPQPVTQSQADSSEEEHVLPIDEPDIIKPPPVAAISACQDVPKLPAPGQSVHHYTEKSCDQDPQNIFLVAKNIRQGLSAGECPQRFSEFRNAMLHVASMEENIFNYDELIIEVQDGEEYSMCDPGDCQLSKYAEKYPVKFPIPKVASQGGKSQPALILRARDGFQPKLTRNVSGPILSFINVQKVKIHGFILGRRILSATSGQTPTTTFGVEIGSAIVVKHPDLRWNTKIVPRGETQQDPAYPIFYQIQNNRFENVSYGINLHDVDNFGQAHLQRGEIRLENNCFNSVTDSVLYDNDWSRGKRVLKNNFLTDVNNVIFLRLKENIQYEVLENTVTLTPGKMFFYDHQLDPTAKNASRQYVYCLDLTGDFDYGRCMKTVFGRKLLSDKNHIFYRRGDLMLLQTVHNSSYGMSAWKDAFQQTNDTSEFTELSP